MATDADKTGSSTIETDRRLLCLTGPESTGKTTLAQALATRFGARLVPEFARGYLAGREDYSREDLLEIAKGQSVLEAEALAQDDGSEGNGLIVCDTDLLVIRIWWEEKYGEVPEALESLEAAGAARAYLLLGPDIVWAPDPLREHPHDRDRLYLRHRSLLTAGRHPFREVEGEGEARLASALSAVRTLFPQVRG